MVGEPGPTLHYVTNTSGKARHAILIDPESETMTAITLLPSSLEELGGAPGV